MIDTRSYDLLQNKQKLWVKINQELNLRCFLVCSQIHSYDTRTAKSYRPHHFRTNIKQLTILYQDPSFSSFSSFKKKMIGFLINWVWIDLAVLPQLIYQHIANRSGLSYKPGGFLEVSSPSHYFYCFILISKWLITDDDDETRTLGARFQQRSESLLYFLIWQLWDETVGFSCQEKHESLFENV